VVDALERMGLLDGTEIDIINIDIISVKGESDTRINFPHIAFP